MKKKIFNRFILSLVLCLLTTLLAFSLSGSFAAPVTKTMVDDSSGSGGGYVTAGGGIDPADPYGVSARGWRMANYGGSVNFPSYEELKDTYDFDSATAVNQLAQISSPGRYKIIGGDYIINPLTAPCKQLGVSAVVFINGSLIIGQSFSNDLDNPSVAELLAARQNCKSATGNPTSVVFIVKDNITVESGVNNIYGIFYAGGDFITEASATPPDGRLYVFGSLLARSFDLRRTLEADNENYPVEQVIFMPRYFLDLGSENLLGRTKVSWRER